MTPLWVHATHMGGLHGVWLWFSPRHLGGKEKMEEASFTLTLSLLLCLSNTQKKFQNRYTSLTSL